MSSSGYQAGASGSDVAIRVRDVSKHYVMFERPEDRFKQMVVPRLERLIGRPPRRYFRDFAALSGVSFEIGRGETIGIIGRNGSGKSTLLQIVCGTLQPTSGSVEVNGRIAALLELGAGFNPEFTGRENVFLNASILGVPRKEMEWRFDDIARFADIGPFLNQPVKTYSSGMYVRLAFATAINVDPDILVVDEALAVGDEAFQRKCFARIEDIKDRGGTILFVSHSAQTIVQLCTRALLIDGGEKILEGQPKGVVSQYQRLMNLAGDEALTIREQIRQTGSLSPQHLDSQSKNTTLDNKDHVLDFDQRNTSNSSDDSWFDPSLVSPAKVEYERQGAKIDRLKIVNLNGDQVNVLAFGKRYFYQYDVEFDKEIYNVGFGMLINTRTGLGIAGIGKGVRGTPVIKQVKKGERVKVSIEFNASLLPDVYFLNAGVMGRSAEGSVFAHRILDGMAFRVAAVPDLEATGIVDLGIVFNHEFID
ncbi:ABC transporter ATP-binding protein [Mesorhizobium sp. B2-7-2]|uniref:ABC transporter ATP-binding protein n=1 Tax=Mesorhizobium sp. B2-7-2 TaxID=2589908 RepID=UPI00112B5145|nr:ABC transporter ATP-binding protein [Mesorhizobium sp. B2-7-2]TPJ28387.1 ABC transporter ATP-binding protein [Mesorhizobium sp. B2-7-2]